MRKESSSIHNESGKTAVIVIIVLAVVGYLVYPGTSPFKSDYYDLKAETNLKDLHRVCNRHWANGMAQRMVSKATGVERVAGDCELDEMRNEYDFKILEEMEIKIIDCSKTGFQATGKHAQGEKLLKIDAHGKIVS